MTEEQQQVDPITGEIITPPDLSQENFRANINRKREADTAEPFDNLVSKLIQTGWERVHLFSADYWFQTYSFQKCGITRKTTDDLLGSIFLGEEKAKQLGKHSFKMQLSEMLDYFDFCKILVEGNWSKIMGDDHTRYAVQSFLSRWQDKGFGLLLSSSNEMTVKILNEQYALYQQPYSQVAKTKGYTDDRVLAFPEGTRGETAKTCLEVFGSLSNISMANEDELRAIPKLGPKKVSLILEHFSKDNDKNLFKYKVNKVYESEDKNTEQGKLE